MVLLVLHCHLEHDAIYCTGEGSLPQLNVALFTTQNGVERCFQFIDVMFTYVITVSSFKSSIFLMCQISRDFLAGSWWTLTVRFNGDEH